MDRNADMEIERQALRRIAALLLALSALACRAAALPWPARCVVLCILNRAEAVAREFVTQEFVAEEFVAPRPRSGHGAADAIRLALSFRVLALAVGGLIARAGRSVPDGNVPALTSTPCLSPRAVGEPPALRNPVPP